MKPSSASRRLNLPRGFGTIWAAVAVDLIGFGIVLPILPIYAKRFDATSFQAAMLVAAFSATSFVFAPIWGRISDRFGRKPALIISLAGTAVGSLITALAGGMPTLYIGRVVDGASGASIAVAQAAAADLAPAEQRPRLFGFLGAAFGVGFVAGPAIGVLAALGGPRWPFLVAAALASINTVIAWVRLPETRPAPRAAGAPEVGASRRPDGSIEAEEAPDVAASKTRRRRVKALVVVAFCAVAGFSAFEATFALFGEQHLGLGIASAAAVFTVAGLVIVAVQGGLVTPLVLRLGERSTLLCGLGADTVGFVLLALSRSWALAAPALLMVTVGQGLVQTTMATTLAGLAGASERGRLLGAQQSAAALARVVGPALGGLLLGAYASGAPYVAAAGLAGLAAAVLVASDRGP